MPSLSNIDPARTISFWGIRKSHRYTSLLCDVTTGWWGVTTTDRRGFHPPLSSLVYFSKSCKKEWNRLRIGLLLGLSE
jgi:hypothetical protein